MSRKKEIESFILTFAMFILYGALDNAAWNWGVINAIYCIWQVLTNKLDLFVALLFAGIITYFTDWVRYHKI